MATRDHSLDQPILESAKQEFLAKGFEKASLKQICGNAGVTTGAVYKRYKDKEELFAAVVAQTVEDLYQIAEEKCSVNLDEISDEDLIKAWDMDTDYMMWWFRFLFDRYDGFVLLIKCAETTRYADFQHDWVEKMTEGTYAYYEEAYRRGLTPVEVSRGELHILLTAFWATIYEPFIHGYTLDEIESHCRLVCKMFDWYTTFEFKGCR